MNSFKKIRKGFELPSMFIIPFLMSVLTSFDTYSESDEYAAIRSKGINIIPRPSKVEPGDGVFSLSPETGIITGEETKKIGAYLADVLSSPTGYPLKVTTGNPSNGRSGQIALLLSGDISQLGEEGYELQVISDRIIIKAAKPAGLFYGCQTLRQLFPVRIENRKIVSGVGWKAPVVRITDKPQFTWRGLMLDPARHFISRQGILKYIDLLAYHKLNRLHLHLTDVDGWRIEIKKYPCLTQAGAWADFGDGYRAGGFYTQEDIREIVEYARERFVTIIPEIETPSHAGAAMVAYPELNCFGTRTLTYGWDPLCGSEFCAGNDSVFTFLDDVISEVAQLFPGSYIHIGGDEAEMKYWEVCNKCRERMRKENLGNVEALHEWFMNKVTRMVESHDKIAIGWHGVARGALFTCWDPDGTSGWNAARNGWDVIFSPGNHLYIDFGFNVTSLKSTYDFDPVPDKVKLTPEARKHVLGVEATLWGELVPEDHMDAQAFPRVLALAERAWGIGAYDFEDFIERVKVQVCRLAERDVLTGPAFDYEPLPAVPARIRDGLPSMIYRNNRNDEDWRWTLTGTHPRLGIYSMNPVFAFDGNLKSHYLTYGPRKDWDAFCVVLQKPDNYDYVKVITGMPNGDHILREGILEISSGYGQWKEVARFKNGVAEAKTDGTIISEVRIRSSINQNPFDLLAIGEIILEKNANSTLKDISPVERLRLPANIP